jgi:signal transduction histidine kinase
MRRRDFLDAPGSATKALLAIWVYRTVVVVFLIASFGCATTLAAEPKRVMLLHSLGPQFGPWSAYAKAIRNELRRQAQGPLDISDHSLVSARDRDETAEIAFVEYLRAIYTRQPLDLIITLGAPAVGFVQRRRQQLFPVTPFVFTALEQRRIRYSDLTENDVVATYTHDFPAFFESILRVLPDTKTLAVVNGKSAVEQFWDGEIRRDAKAFEHRMTFRWYNELSFEDILKDAAALPLRSAIFFELMSIDAAGVVHEGDTALKRLHAVANAPIFSYQDAFFGREIVGGPMHSVPYTSERAVAAAIRILQGEKPSDIKFPVGAFSTAKYNWQEMQRWGISESRLPPGSEIHFRPPTIWQQYFWHMVALLTALALQTALIVGLFYEDRRRRRSEANARVLMGELAHTNRLITAGQLTASLAHEIRQPLSAVAAYCRAGLNWLKHEPPNLDEARTGLENSINEVHRADGVIESVRALFKNESTTRTEVNLNELVQQVLTFTSRTINSNRIVLETDFIDNPTPYVMADPGQLQQVILNLITNAIEAMSAPEQGAKMLRIETSIDQTDSVVITVADSGPGFDSKVAEQLFKPFFTTKSSGMGLGLPICKSIIEGHQGKLTIASREPHGAVFRIELPRHSHENN